MQSLVRRGVPFDVALATATAIRDRIAPRGEGPPGGHLQPRRRAARRPLRPRRARRRHRDRAAARGRGGRLLEPVLEGHPGGLPDGRRASSPRTPTTWRARSSSALLRQGRAAIDRTELRHLVAATIERTDGPGPARWYRVWRSARDDGKPSLVLLGGATGSGKTSLAIEVARRLELPARDRHRFDPPDHASRCSRPTSCPRSTARPSTPTWRCRARRRWSGDPVVVGLSRAGAEDRGRRARAARAGGRGEHQHADRGREPGAGHARARPLPGPRARHLHHDGDARPRGVSQPFRRANRQGAQPVGRSVPRALRRDPGDPALPGRRGRTPRTADRGQRPVRHRGGGGDPRGDRDSGEDAAAARTRRGASEAAIDPRARVRARSRSPRRSRACGTHLRRGREAARRAGPGPAPQAARLRARPGHRELRARVRRGAGEGRAPVAVRVPLLRGRGREHQRRSRSPAAPCT